MQVTRVTHTTHMHIHMHTQVTDCERRRAEYVRSAAQCASNFDTECKKLGVDRTDVRGSLRELTRELPQHLGKVWGKVWG